MKNDVVGLVRVADDNLTANVGKALDLVNFKIDRTVESVFIKVNLCYYWDSFTGYTTDPKLVGSIIDVLREKYRLRNSKIKIVEADATAMRTSHAFKMLRYEELAEKKGVTLFNLTEDKTITKNVEVNGKQVKFDIAESLLNADLLINVPKMKIMSKTILTCALKNMFGCIQTPRKMVYHRILDEAIVGINKILKPHLTVVDGLVALSHSPVKMNLIVTGLSPFSVDWIVSRIMGYNPSRVNYLRLAAKEGLGDPNGITSSGENIAELKKMFPHVNAFRLRSQNEFQLKLLRFYSRVVGDVIPPFLET